MGRRLFTTRSSRHVEAFDKKKDADARHATVKVDVSRGVHVAASKSITVAEAGKLWADAAEAEGLQRATVKTYREHVNLHIVPRIKLSDISVPVVAQFKQRLRSRGVSAALIKKVMVSLGLGSSRRRSSMVRSPTMPCASCDNRRRRGKQERGERKAKLRVGTDIPTREEIGAMLAHAPGAMASSAPGRRLHWSPCR